MEQQILASVYAEVQRRFASVDDPAHDWAHIQRVYHLALHIAGAECADRFIVGMAALMHDLGQSVRVESVQHHADASLTLARELLTTHQVADDVRQAILHAIAAHSFSRGIVPRTLEACVVRDADRLDGLGAIGILRWAVTGTIRRTSQTRLYHPDDPLAIQRALDDRAYMLDHFFTKLLKIGDTMTTATGRAMAERRIAFMRSYLDELQWELKQWELNK
jgi:uncharacterized protein